MKLSRLPGISFEHQTPPLEASLPRMDIAVFVGFAAKGPLHTPVVLEDVQRFAAVFGPDLALAWDARKEQSHKALLAPSVRAFFRNGGRRCWVIRVAGGESNRFRLPGLLSLTAEGLSPVYLQATSPGSWSDALEVRAALALKPLTLLSLTEDLSSLTCVASGTQVGDLLRLTNLSGHGVLLAVKAVAAAATAGQEQVWVQALAWFSPDLSSFEHSAQNVEVELLGGSEVTVLAAKKIDKVAEDCLQVDLELTPTSRAALQAGSYLRLRHAWSWVTLLIEHSGDCKDEPSCVRVQGRGLCYRTHQPHDQPAFAADSPLEQLHLSLQVRHAQEGTVRLDGLRFCPEHPRALTHLPPDEALYAPPTVALRPLSEAERAVRETLWPEVRALNFPLAAQTGGACLLPDSLGLLPESYVGASPSAAERIARDGLHAFGADLFLDPRLANSGPLTLLSEAQALRDQENQNPTPLQGIHAALPLEEATLIAVPDAAQRPWELGQRASLRVIKPPELSARWEASEKAYKLSWSQASLNGTVPEGSIKLYRLEQSPDPIFAKVKEISLAEQNYLVTQSAPGTYFYRVVSLDEALVKPWSPGDITALWSNTVSLSLPYRAAGFEACTTPALPPPQLAFETAAYLLHWNEPEAQGLQPTGRFSYLLEWATEPDFSATEGYKTAALSFALRPESAEGYYRVRAVYTPEEGAEPLSSPWSLTLALEVPPSLAARALPEERYEDSTLLTVQRALLRLCAARADLVAVLGLAEHYREPEVLRHVSRLQAGAAAQALSPEGQTLSYGALYHPWLLEGSAPDYRTTSPEGALCGLIARRALARGAWVAPANDPLQGVVALKPAFPESSWAALQAAQLNLIRQEPRGFLTLSASTLSLDEDLMPLGVRRLLILLRRLALREGSRYTFEPLNAAFGRGVERSFEALLGQMFRRGAFRGRTAEQGYRVMMGSDLNPPRSLEAGRFVVELRVAPSQPLRFLTVRLVQTGERGLTIEERGA